MSRITSPSRLSIDIIAERFSVTGLPPTTIEEENLILRKQLRQIDTEYRTTRAVLEQKIEILESQITDFQNRESNLKKMNETIMVALNEIEKDQYPLVNKTAKELEIATERHNKEMHEYRARTNEMIKNLEIENRKLKDSSAENELRVKELTLHFEKAQMTHFQTLNNFEQERVELENKIKKLEEEKQQMKESMENDCQAKINELKGINQRLTEEHKRECQKEKETYEKSLQDLKTAYENEKKSMETRMSKMQEVLLKEGTRREASTAEIHTKYQKEIQSLKDLTNQMKTEHAIEINELKRERDEANDKAQKFDAQAKKLKAILKDSQNVQEHNNKIIKEKLEKAKTVIEHGEILAEENKKYREKVGELKTQIKKLETSEKKLRQLVYEKEVQFNEERIEIKKMLNFEQSLSAQSVQEPQLSQSMHQEKKDYKNGRSKVSSATHSYSQQKNTLASSYPGILPSGDRRSVPYPIYSPLREKSPNVDTRSISLQGYERNISSPMAITPQKQPRSPLADCMNGKPESMVKKEQLESFQATLVNNFKAAHELCDMNVSNAGTAAHRKTPLETSFADQGFVLENDLETLKTENSRAEKSKEKRFSRQIDVDTIPINYNEFVKRTQRSKAQSIDPEKIIQSEIDSKVGSISGSETGPQLFFTTSYDDHHQPLFGTSHFMLEGMPDVQEEEETERSKGFPRNEERRVQNIIEQEKKSRYEKDYDLRYEEDSYKQTEPVEDEFDVVEISELGEVDYDRFSYNLKRRGSSKCYIREELETRPNLTSSVNTAYESALGDGFDHQSSIGFSSGYTRSVVERDREREKVFTSRRSVNKSGYKRESDIQERNNDTRYYVEGRLKDLEWQLKNMELKNHGLKIEKDKVQLEYEKLMFQLREKKAESENLKSASKAQQPQEDDKKDDREGALKNEIKFLINKLLKVKNKLEKQSEELITKKVSSTLGQSQLNSSVSGYYLAGKKDYSREYGTLAGGQTFVSNQARERENWNPAYGQSNNWPKSDYSDMLQSSSNLKANTARTDAYKENYKKSRASQNFPLDVLMENSRSRSNSRNDYGRNSNNASVQNSATKNKETNMSISTTRTHRTRMPNIPRPEESNGSLGSIVGRDGVRNNNTNTHIYDSFNTNNISAGYDTNNSFSYQRKSTR